MVSGCMLSSLVAALLTVPVPEEGPSPPGQTNRVASASLAGEQPAPRRLEWLDMFVAILRGKALEEGKGWWRPAQSLHGWRWLSEFYDADRDGKIEPKDLGKSRDHFGRLDRDEDGLIERDDLEGPAPPDPPAHLKELFERLDSDRNDRVSWDEFSWFFQQADRRKRGFLSRRDLAAALGGFAAEPTIPALGSGEEKPKESRGSMPPTYALLYLFFTGQLGSFREGPDLGGEAPDFSLPPLAGGDTVRLSSARGRQPVVLIFGSFT